MQNIWGTEHELIIITYDRYNFVGDGMTLCDSVVLDASARHRGKDLSLRLWH